MTRIMNRAPAFQTCWLFALLLGPLMTLLGCQAPPSSAPLGTARPSADAGSRPEGRPTASPSTAEAREIPAPLPPGTPRCVTAQPPSPGQPMFCVRLVTEPKRGQIRVVTHTSSATGAPASDITAALDSKPLHQVRREQLQQLPIPMRVMVVLQLTEQRMPALLAASVRSLADAVFLSSKSTMGIVAYERTNRIVEELPLSSKETVLARLAILEKRPVNLEGKTFSTSDTVATALTQMSSQLQDTEAMKFIIAFSTGEDDKIGDMPKRTFANFAVNAANSNVVFDWIYLKEAEGGRRPYVRDLPLKTGGIYIESTPDELRAKTDSYVQLLRSLQVVDFTLHPQRAEDTERGRHRLVVSTDPPQVSVPLDVMVSLSPPVEPTTPPPTVANTAPVKTSARPGKSDAIWWWLTAFLLLGVGSLLLLPSVREPVRIAFLGAAIPTPLNQAQTIPNLSIHEFSPSLGRLVAEQRRPPTPRPPVEWMEPTPPGQNYVAWLLALDTGRVFYLDKSDIILGNDPACAIFILGIAPTAFRCRFYRDPNSRQTAIYPLDGAVVEHRSQRLSGPSYVLDQDEVRLGVLLFRYFETRTIL